MFAFLLIRQIKLKYQSNNHAKIQQCHKTILIIDIHIAHSSLVLWFPTWGSGAWRHNRQAFAPTWNQFHIVITLRSETSVSFLASYCELPAVMHIPCTLNTVSSNMHWFAQQQCCMWWCSKSVYKAVVPPGRPVQRCSQGTAGAPAASNPHSCSPGLEPLQSPAVPPALGTACLGGRGDGVLIITTSNMQARGQTQTVTLPITAMKPGQEPGHRATLQPGRAGWRGGGSVGVRSFPVSFHFLFSAPPPPFWGWRGVCRLGYYAGDRSLDTGRLCLEACRWCDGLDLKT